MIPRRAFQTIGVLAMIACVVVSLGYAYHGGQPFAWIATWSVTLSALCALLTGLVLSFLFIVPLRSLSDMKPISEEIKELTVERLIEEKQRIDAMKHGTPAERRRYHLRLAAVSPVCLLIGGPIVTGAYEVNGPIFVLPVALALYGVFGPFVHLAIAYVAGRERRP